MHHAFLYISLPFLHDDDVKCLISCFKVMLHKTIRNDESSRSTALHHCCDIVSNGCNIVPILQRCVALKSSLRIVPCNITLSVHHNLARALVFMHHVIILSQILRTLLRTLEIL